MNIFITLTKTHYHLSKLSVFQATDDTSDTKRFDIEGSGLHNFPDIMLQSTQSIEELHAGQNKLQEIALNALTDFPNLKILRLPGNEFKYFPEALLDIEELTVLDLANNQIDGIPSEIWRLKK